MSSLVRFAKRLLRYACLIYPALWLYLPNLILMFINPELAFKLKTIGLMLTVVVTLPIVLLVSQNLRQFWLWNLPFALCSGLYSGYILQYHDIPYDGIWFAIGTASADVNLGMMHYFSGDILKGLLGFVLYVLCLLHPAQKEIRILKMTKEIVVCLSLVIIALTLSITQFLSRLIPIQRMLDLSVVTKSYPYGMLAMCIKTAVSVSHQSHITLAPLIRKVIPKGREIYIFVLGEAARQDDWQTMSLKMHSSLLQDPDIRIFHDAVSQANLTSFSIPLILTGTSSLQQALTHPNWVEYARAAGCQTGWLTNSTEPYHYSYQSNFYDLNFDHYRLSSVTSAIYDDVLLPEITRAITQGPEKMCLVVHLIGSHFDYRERYRADHALLKFSNAAYENQDDPGHTEAFHDAYKNSIIETNILLQNILAILKKQNATSVMIYTADHAESFNDHEDHQYFHGNPHPRPVEMRVPLLVWASKSFQASYPEKWQALTANQSRQISTRQIIPTLMDVLNVEVMPAHLSPSLFQAYRIEEKRWVYLPSAKVVDFATLE